MSPRLRRFLSILGPTAFALGSVWLAVSIVQRDDAPTAQIVLGVTGAAILVIMDLGIIYKLWRESRQPTADA